MTLDHTISVPHVPGLTGRQKLWLVFLVIMKRARFFAILAGVGLFVGYWDAVKNHWDRWMHPRSAAVRALPEGQEFFCPMDPKVTRSGYEPNGSVPNCPICGMPLSLRAMASKEKLPPGITGRVSLSPDRVQMAGIKTVAVEYRPMSKQIKTVGYVTFDESGLSRIVSRVDGYVEKLYADKSYAMVREGDPLAEIYSPELYSTAKELIVDKKSGVSPEMVESARQKLLLLGVSKEEIAAIENTQEPPKRLVIRSPRTGHVIEKKIVVGSSVEAKMTLFEVADLSTVWIEAEVYENDAPFLQAGEEITARVESYPNRTFRGRLALVHPHLEEATRTNRVRIKFENNEHELRPGMFAEVTIDAPLETIEPYKTLAEQNGRHEFLVVPQSAVIDTGAKKIVYIERGEGQYEGHEVELGPPQDDFYPVLKGLSAGDRVASAGSFLVDAETRLNPAAASIYFGASGGQQTAGSMPAPAAQQPSPEKAADAKTKTAVVFTVDDLKNIDQLETEEDRQQARAQGICPVTDKPLGWMGVPVKITLRGKTVFVCCKGCIGKAKHDPDAMLKKLVRP